MNFATKMTAIQTQMGEMKEKEKRYAEKTAMLYDSLDALQLQLKHQNIEFVSKM